MPNNTSPHNTSPPVQIETDVVRSPMISGSELPSSAEQERMISRIADELVARALAVELSATTNEVRAPEPEEGLIFRIEDINNEPVGSEEPVFSAEPVESPSSETPRLENPAVAPVQPNIAELFSIFQNHMQELANQVKVLATQSQPTIELAKTALAYFLVIMKQMFESFLPMLQSLFSAVKTAFGGQGASDQNPEPTVNRPRPN